MASIRTSLEVYHMKQEVVTSHGQNTERTVEDLISQLKQPLGQYSAVIFSASVAYDFPALAAQIKEKFPQAEVIGTSTSGEISQNGFAKQSVVLTALSCSKTKFSGVLLSGVDKFPITQRADIERAAEKRGIRINNSLSHKDAFALTFVNGLCNAEEALLSLFYAVIKNDQFVIAGGSAGDDLQFKQTFVSYNGKTVSDGAVILFVKTMCAFDIRKENIFKPTGTRLTITEADTYSRKIISIDGMNPRKRYAESLGLSESQVGDAALSHPFGRVFGGNTFITSIAGFNADGTINMYSRVLTNSTLDVLELLPIEEKTSMTCDNIMQTIPDAGCVLLVNCILRTIIFEQQKICPKLISQYHAKISQFAGFSSYGEQIGRINSNQTLVTIAIGE